VKRVPYCQRVDKSLLYLYVEANDRSLASLQVTPALGVEPNRGYTLNAVDLAIEQMAGVSIIPFTVDSDIPWQAHVLLSAIGEENLILVIGNHTIHFDLDTSESDFVYLGSNVTKTLVRFENDKLPGLSLPVLGKLPEGYTITGTTHLKLDDTLLLFLQTNTFREHFGDYLYKQYAQNLVMELDDDTGDHLASVVDWLHEAGYQVELTEISTDILGGIDAARNILMASITYTLLIFLISAIGLITVTRAVFDKQLREIAIHFLCGASRRHTLRRIAVFHLFVMFVPLVLQFLLLRRAFIFPTFRYAVSITALAFIALGIGSIISNERRVYESSMEVIQRGIDDLIM